MPHATDHISQEDTLCVPIGMLGIPLADALYPSGHAQDTLVVPVEVIDALDKRAQSVMSQQDTLYILF